MADLLRLSIKGTLPTGEEWSVNPVWALSDFPVATTPAQVQAVATACAAVNPGANMILTWTSSTALTGIRVEARTKGGALENQAEAIKAVPVIGTGSVAHPFQTAWVTSLRTSTVGGSGRGRLYWPATGVGLSNGTLRPSTPSPALVLSAYQTYLSGIQTAIKTVFSTAVLAVWSRKNSALYNVNSLQMGDVLDVQRRRRDTLVENYLSASFP